MNNYFPQITLSSVRCRGPVSGFTGDVRLSFGGVAGDMGSINNHNSALVRYFDSTLIATGDAYFIT